MANYTAARARQDLAEVLDRAEQGERVIIERRGVRFVVQAQPQRRDATRRPSPIEWMDPLVEAGEWTWAMSAKGMTFASRRVRSSARKPKRIRRGRQR